ncbi:pilus assembly protein [Shewanella sp. YIC-542]|uniref:pilus assembly protein n=1 Tax=Shewanella mytili TaxID=3377111 RepID=UPI00398F480F
MKLKKVLCSFFFMLIGFASQGWGDDTDLYLLPPPNQGRAKVLIIFDNSASMDTMEYGVPGSYDPTEDYAAYSSSHSYQERMIYFTVGSGMDDSSLPVPDSPSESRRFNELLNGCAVAKTSLEKYGRFTGYIREYVFNGTGKGTWQPIKENSGGERNNPVDCWEDIEAANPGNNGVTVDGVTYGNGYPQNNVSSGKTYRPYGGTDADALNNATSMGFNQGELVTLYSDNYLRWYTLYKNGQLDGSQNLSRLDIAKSAISGVISSMPSVDFGLAVFNLDFPYEGYRDGGRIIAGIRHRTAPEKDLLLETIKHLPAETNTPLCETLFEAYRYFSGGPITFGHSDDDYFSHSIYYIKNQPPYDTSIENGGYYDSPMSVCSDIAYIIYVTDGVPSLDNHADTKITALTTASGVSNDGNYAPVRYKDSRGHDKYSYLPALASYMYRNDILPDTEKFQRVVTHTIGFALDKDSDAEPLLVETAKRGNGEYHAANSVADLQQAFSNVLESITEKGQRFSAPGVAFSNADPTRTLDSAYYALFSPSQGPRWAGNLKKLKVNASGVLVGANGKAAIASNGGIADDTCSVWSNCSPEPDGNDVQEGGVARTIVPDNRTIYSNIGTGGKLSPLSKNSASAFAGGDSALLAHMNMFVRSGDESAALETAFEWIKGKNVDKDENGEFTSDDFSGVRGDIMGDPMHSQPLAIDFGGDASNVRVFVGTNHGMLHAFKDLGDSVEESWAFMPYELLRNVQELRDNSYANGHSVYGIDGSPVAYLERNTSGVVTKAWIFFGMRRGGDAYYAFDVTSPDSPQLMWRIDSSTAGFTNMGQTWSTPVVTNVLGIDEPVVIFGGGYNQGYDGATGSNSDGRNVYLVNAKTGTLEYTFGVGGNTSLAGIENGIAGAVATLDSNGDGITDRLYAADLGGDIWRMDMPSKDTASWSGFKFASLGGQLTLSDRRFFYKPIVAQTILTNVTSVTVKDGDGNVSTTMAYQNVPYDAVAVGSGDRATPLGAATEDMFFVLQDRNVVSKTFGGAGNASVPTPISLNNLYDVTQAAPDSDSDNIDFGAKLGWYYRFKTVGEKSLSPATIIKGKAYFTSFIPAQSVPETPASCLISSIGRLYTFDLHKGGRYSKEFLDICEDCIPQPPKYVTPPKDPDDPDDSGNSDAVLIIGKGECDETGENCSGTVPLDTGMTTNKIYYHVNE